MQLQVDCGFDVYLIVNVILVLVEMAHLEPHLELTELHLFFC